MATCDTCLGHGEVDCEECDSSGVDPQDPDEGNCEACQGDGTVECDTCGGSGEVQ